MDGQRLASAGPGAIKLWDVRTGQQLRAFKGSADTLLFSPDGQQLASATELGSGVMQLWDVATGNEVCTVSGHFRSLAFSADHQRLLGVGSDMIVASCGTTPGAEVLRTRCERGGFTNTLRAVLSADGRRVASSSYRGTIEMWNAATGKRQATLKGRTKVYFQLLFSPDGRQLATRGADGAVEIWAVGRGDDSRILQARDEPVFDPSYCASAVAFSPDGRRLAAASHLALNLWDVATGQLLRTLQKTVQKPGEPLQFLLPQLAFSPDGQWLASTGGVQTPNSPATVTLWDVSSARVVRTLQPDSPYGRVASIVFSPDGHWLATVGQSSEDVQLWNMSEDGAPRTLHTGRVESIAFSPDGRCLATAFTGVVKLWELAAGKESGTLKTPSNQVDCVAFSPDGQRLAMAASGGVDSDGIVTMWDVVHGQELFEMRGHVGMMWSLVFSPDGRRLVSAGQDQTARVWDTIDGRPLRTVKAPTRSSAGVLFNPSRAAFSPDGYHLAFASGTVLLLDARPLTDEVRTELAAKDFVEFLSKEGLSRPDAIARIRDEKRITEAARQKSLEFADLYFRAPEPKQSP